MFDARVRRLIDPPLTAAGAELARRGVTADQVTIAAAIVGLVGAAAIALGWPLIGLALILAGRLGDGLDGAVARAATGPTDRGGYLDIVSDFVVYAAVPLAFAAADPANALAAAALLASFLFNGAAFLAYAVMAERRGLVSDAQGVKSLYYLAGLMEGAETIAFFAAFCLWPGWFPQLAAIMAALCLVSGAARSVIAWRTLD
jgi:phosphatidylglycerophosphate synthase